MGCSRGDSWQTLSWFSLEMFESTLIALSLCSKLLSVPNVASRQGRSHNSFVVVRGLCQRLDGELSHRVIYHPSAKAFAE
jgi:hypothetical protein